MGFQGLLSNYATLPSIINSPTQHLTQSDAANQNNKAQLRKPRFNSYNTMLEQFVKENAHLSGIEFIEQLLQSFNFSFQTPWNQKERIPSEGRVVIIANQPLGSLDAAAVFKLVREVRSDLKVVVENNAHQLQSLKPITLPHEAEIEGLNGFDYGLERSAIHDWLKQEGALIIFPSQDLSRVRPNGVRDPKWRKDFLKLALQANAPILPVYIDATHSALFYSISTLSKPLSSMMLVSEMYKQSRRTVSIQVGKLIPYSSFASCQLPLKTQVKQFKKHLYEIGKGKPGLWPTQSPVAHPESRQELKQLVADKPCLGHTKDDKQILLYQPTGSCSLLREIGRLREISFRAIGEGTGQRRDIDSYDHYYNQLVLWDENDLEVVGAYRLGEAKSIIEKKGVKGLYSASLFNFDPELIPKLMQGAELGRSFVQPKHWGKRSLDYLWYGIGSYLSKHPEVRYLFGPVSITNDLPKRAKDLLVYFFTLYFGDFDESHSFIEALPPRQKQPRAVSRNPYQLSYRVMMDMKDTFSGKDYKEDFVTLKSILSNMGCSVPTLYKQYGELCEPGGVKFLGFGVDPDFNDCIDGFVMVDVHKLKPKKRQRYIPESNRSIDT